ncbi:MAG: hypothetical protein WBG01_00915 [Bacteroidota bacterium]
MSKLSITNGTWTLELSEHGHLLGLHDGSTRMHVRQKEAAICELLFGSPERNVVVASAQITRKTASSAHFETVLDLGTPVALRFSYEVREPDGHGTAVLCRFQLLPDALLDTDVHLRWFWGVRLTEPGATIFAPLFDGRGLRTNRQRRQEWHYVCVGGWDDGGGEGKSESESRSESRRLAVPLIDESAPESRFHVAYFADPFFSTGIALSPDESPEFIQCRFLKDAGAGQFPERTFGLYLHGGGAETALEGFFRHGIENSPPGPAWLHDIAMVHYDFFSEKGEGWFRDIDKLVELFGAEDRTRIALTLHGCYDFLGRYCFNEKTKQLDDKWTVMKGTEGLEMSLREIHKRLAYANERGFRVLLYFADGLAIDSAAPNYDESLVFREPDGTLRTHYWSGPDTSAQTYIMDPLHPGVQDFFRGYMEALLAEFGGEIDGLNWDETFTIKTHDISRGETAGYASRVFMFLCKELREMVKARNPDIAFLASDCTQLSLPLEDGTYWSVNTAQNALVFDGTYQDSQCYPAAWQYGLFPNYRNVLWSCNWKPVENFEWTKLGVRAFGAPVAVSNGWGENRGVSRYSEEEIRKLIELFREKKAQPGRVKWIELGDRGFSGGPV